jgi:hypothetical protein
LPRDGSKNHGHDKGTKTAFKPLEKEKVCFKSIAHVTLLTCGTEGMFSMTGKLCIRKIKTLEYGTRTAAERDFEAVTLHCEKISNKQETEYKI